MRERLNLGPNASPDFDDHYDDDYPWMGACARCHDNTTEDGEEIGFLHDSEPGGKTAWVCDACLQELEDERPCDESNESTAA